MSEILESKLSALRLRSTLVSLATGGSMALVFLIAALAGGMLLDWMLELPRIVRGVFLLADMIGLAYVLVRYALYPVIYNADDETLALAVERFHPSFATRLIATIQFSRPDAVPTGSSAALVRAMIRQTEEMAQPVDFSEVVQTDQLRKFGTIAGALTVVALLLAMFAGNFVGPLFKRALLFQVPLPTRTHIEPITGDTTVARGEAATLSVRVSGWHPPTGTAEIVYASGRKQTIMIEPSRDDPNVYSGVLDAVPEDFKYRIRIYDAHTTTFTVEVLPPPAVASLKIEQIYPEYTGLGTQRRAPGDLLILMGSKLRLSVATTKACRVTADNGARVSLVHLYGTAANQADIPLVANPANPLELTASILPPDSTNGFSINLVDQRGVRSQDPAIYRIDMIPDRAPQVRIWRPDRKEILVTINSNPLIGFTAEDDLGLGNIALHYKINDGPVQSVPVPYEPNDSNGQHRRTLKALYRWPMTKIPVPAGKPNLEGSVLEYWIECLDNKAPTPNSAESEHYQARVVTAAEKQAELMSRLSESLGAINHLADDQTTANQDLGAVVIEGSGNDKSPTREQK